ncbi:hypothetical protein KIF59_01290 [Enterobacter cloacae subsp. cloacae]|nr:hypothetical protein [Enterobacter cloacae subsp. cloacae]
MHLQRIDQTFGLPQRRRTPDPAGQYAEDHRANGTKTQQLAEEDIAEVLRAVLR